MKIEALPSVIFATLVIDLRIWLATIFLTVLLVPTITYAKSKPNVAVVYFDNNSGDAKMDPLSKGFADMLITDLSSSKQVTVVEREKLQTLLEESELQQTKFFDPKTAVTIGKGLGASHVVAGAFITASPKMRVDVRLIEIATSKVILSAQVQGPSDDIFDLEQKLVEKFLKKLDLKFYPEDLPATKVPNLKTLVSYSVGLGLADKGQDAQAAVQLKKVVRMAPAFALARIRHAEFIARIEIAKTQRGDVLKRGTQTLYAHAKAHLKSTGGAVRTPKDAGLLLGYQLILRHQAATALHATLVGRRPTQVVVPTRGEKNARRAMQRYADIQRQIVESHSGMRKQFPKASLYFELSDADEALAKELDISYRDSNSYHTLLRFLLDGRVEASGSLESFTMSPAPSDMSPKLKKYALTLAEKVIANTVHIRSHSVTSAAVQTHELLAEWHIRRDRIEEGIAEYQKILDGFPSLKRWDYYEKKIHEQLGIKHEYLAGRKREYSLGIKTCDSRKINAAQVHVLSSRMRSQGIPALKAMYDEVAKACKTTPNFDRIEKSLVRTLASKAGEYDECALLNRFEGKWIKLGGSKNSALSYRKRYNCN